MPQNEAAMNYRELRKRLEPLYGEGEARAVADRLLEDVFGLTKADIICGAVERLSPADSAWLSRLADRLLANEPVQYVVGRTEFLGRRFITAPGALIPRPETEELCAWIISESSAFEAPDILDIGTGTGCIACTLALDIQRSRVCGWDISADALAIAAENAALLKAPVMLEKQDILSKSADSARWNIIVSNPPYVCLSEKSGMSPNVTEYEPHSALFVPDADPLLFYRAIARYACAALKPRGRLFLELNPLYACELAATLEAAGLKDIMIKEDMCGKKRMASAVSD